MSKIVSQLDEQGYFISAVEADPSPLEPGVWLLPGGCVDIAPPTVQPGKRYQIVEGNWAAEDQPEPEKPAAPDIWLQIKAERDRRKAGGVQVDGKWFHTDTDSRMQQMTLSMLGPRIPAGLQWQTMDGSKVAMTPALAQQLCAAVVSADNALFTLAETHRAAMQASADPTTYNWHTGWPLIYGETGEVAHA